MIYPRFFSHKSAQASKQIILRAVSVFVMFCLLTTSIFAVPTNIAGSAAEAGQDVRFAFISSSISTSFYNLFNFSFLKLRTSPNPTPVVSIQVFPGSVTIQQGEKATFPAIGFDADGRPRFADIVFGSGGRIGDRDGFTVPFAFGIRIIKNRGR